MKPKRMAWVRYRCYKRNCWRWKFRWTKSALVASVAPNGPSEKAGVKAGDIILEFNGERIQEMKELLL